MGFRTATRWRPALEAKGQGEELFDAALRNCAPHFKAAWIFSALIALLYLAPSIYMLQVYDRVLATDGVMTLAFMSIALAFALATHAFLDVTRQRLLARASLRLERTLGERIIRQSFDDAPGGDARSAQILREFDTFRQAIQGPIATAVLDLPFAPLFVLVAFALHVWLGLLVLGGAVLLVTIAVLGERATKRDVAANSERTPSVYAAAELAQVFGGAVRALGMRGSMTRRLGNERQKLNELSTRSTFVAMHYSGMIRLLRMALQSATLGLGAYLAIRQEITPGSLIAATILSGRALAPIDQIVGSWRQLGQARNARSAIIRFLDGAAADEPHMQLPTPEGALEFESVVARSGAGDRLALQAVSFALAPGEMLGVIGASGAGKSTLARLLVGAQHPDAGAVRIDGSNIKDWDSDSLGAHLGYLPQEVALFSGSIADNISRFSGRPNVGERIVAAAQGAGVHAMIQTLPQGYDTVLGPRGAGLSAGQSQRVALARALFGDPRILVLDEPNSHLDSDGDASLLAAMSAAKARGATVVIMTHRSGILAAADKLLVLKDGQVVQFGPRDMILSNLRKTAVQSGQVRAVGSRGQA